MKKISYFIVLLVLNLLLVACSATQTTSGADEGVTVKVGVSGADDRIWDYIATKAEKEGIKVEVIRFSDYVQPNLALAEGDLDANAFQTVSYFEAFTREHGLDLTPLATTILAPMGIYSQQYEAVDQIPPGGKIAIPNDASNQARALLLLQEADLITLADDFTSYSGLEGIEENPKQLEIIPMVAGQTPRVLPDVAASIINNGIAVDAGFSPLQDAIFHENETATPYVNIIAVRTGDEERPELQRLATLYQSEDVAQFILAEYDGNMIPTFIPVNTLK